MTILCDAGAVHQEKKLVKLSTDIELRLSSLSSI